MTVEPSGQDVDISTQLTYENGKYVNPLDSSKGYLKNQCAYRKILMMKRSKYYESKEHFKIMFAFGSVYGNNDVISIKCQDFSC